jgi:hypothetical protein
MGAGREQGAWAQGAGRRAQGRRGAGREQGAWAQGANRAHGRRAQGASRINALAG